MFGFIKMQRTKINGQNISGENELEEIKMAVQVNGKTRDVINIKKDLMEKDVNNFIIKNSKAKKYLDGKKNNENNFCEK